MINNMQIVALGSFITMMAYLVFCAIKYGVKDYVSQNYYIAKEKWLFSVVMIETAVCLTPCMVSMGGENWGFLGALAGFGLLLVGIEPHYKDYRGVAHNFGAYLAAIASLVFCAIYRPWWILYAFIALILVWKAFNKRHVFYIAEVLIFILVYATIICQGILLKK